MSHLHEHCCEHTEVKYCKVCRVVYCVKCGKEWRESGYTWTMTYPQYTYVGTGATPLTATDGPLGNTKTTYHSH